MQPPALRFQRLTKHYGSVRALRDIDLEIGSGEFFGLVGMNGAGKTTLIKCLLDFCAADGGTIEIFGTGHRQAEARKRLAFLSHTLADVEEICDRMAILHNGTLRYVGSPADCCRQYGTNTLEQAYLKCIG